MTTPTAARATPDPTARPRRRAAAVQAWVLRSERLSPHLVRLVVGGPGIEHFVPNPHADTYVKLAFPTVGDPADRPRTEDGLVDMEALREQSGPDAPVRLRAYTIRRFDAAAQELAIDLVVHGDEGVAGPWALAAVPGDEVLMLGPGGAWTPSPDAGAHLLVGDASALPAVAAGLERLPADAVGHAFVEVASSADELALTHPVGVEVVWVHAEPDAPGAALVEAVTDMPWPAPAGGDRAVHVFLHGEAGMVRALRRHVREHGVAREHLSASGYWRLGVDDEGWRAGKREWAQAVEADEATTPA